jgi:hypothetical protein
VSDAQYPPLVTAGQDLAFGSYRVENVGTTTINAPTVEWYLTSLRNFVSSYYYLGTATYDQAIPPNGKYDPSETTFTVPKGVPEGDYYLAAFIRNDGGASQASFPYSNNYGFSRLKGNSSGGYALWSNDATA